MLRAFQLWLFEPNVVSYLVKCVSESVRRRREQVESLGLLWTSADHTHHVQPFTDSKQ